MRHSGTWPARCRKGWVLVRAREPAVADDISDQDCRNLAGLGQGAPSAAVHISTTTDQNLRPPLRTNFDLGLRIILDVLTTNADIPEPVRNVPDLLFVLVEIATYVYCADKATGRGGDVQQGMGSA